MNFLSIVTNKLHISHNSHSYFQIPVIQTEISAVSDDVPSGVVSLLKSCKANNREHLLLSTAETAVGKLCSKNNKKLFRRDAVRGPPASHLLLRLL